MSESNALHWRLLTLVCVILGAGGGVFAIVVLFPLAYHCGAGWRLECEDGLLCIC